MSNIRGQADNRGDIMRRLHRLERQIQELQAGRGLAASTIGQGGIRIKDGGGIRLQGGGNVAIEGGALRVFDAAGNLTATVGLFPDGQENGIAAVDPTSGALVSLATLAFGLRGAVNTSVVTVNATTWGDPAFGDPGPTIPDLPIGNSGRAIVFLGAQFGVLNIPEGLVGECQMSFEVSGATSRPPGIDVVALGRQASGTGGVDVGSGQFCNIAVLDELNPGLHTIKAQYQITGDMTDGNIFRPTLVALPY